MSEADLTRVPTGEMGWAALLAYAVETDDRIERYFLEVKSDIDLKTKKGRAKVAKFILGAANRDPEQAASRFGGHAVMLLGVGNGLAAGIPSFEAMDLARDVQKFIGVEGPRWDFDRIPAQGGQDVIAIVAAPPTGQVWTCLADGEGLCDGDIYVRADGETRKAKGDEVRAMLERAAIPRPLPLDIGLELMGEIAAIKIDIEALVEAIEQKREGLLAQLEPRGVGGLYGGAFAGIGSQAFTRDVRSKDQFRSEVETWTRRAKANPSAGVLKAMGRAREGLRIRVTNRTRTFLRDVRIEIDIGADSAVTATEWQEPDTEYPIELFPGIPQGWGDSSVGSLLMPRSGLATYPASRHGNVEIKQGTPARLVLTMDTLRPQEDFTTDNEEVVLVLVTDQAPADPLPARWRLTADGVNDVYEGEIQIAATFTDLRHTIAELLRGQLDA